MKNTIISVILTIAVVIAFVPVSGTSEVHAEEAPEIATWEGWRKAAATFTFDDGAPSHYTDAAPLFDKYGYKATFYLVTNWNPNWAEFQKLADNGHEIGSHSDNHYQNMKGEEASSKTNIESKISSKYGCITVAYPNCNVPNETEVLNNYIAGRIGNGSWQSLPDINSKDGPPNWCKVSALMTGTEGTVKKSEDFVEQFLAACEINGWVAFMTHGFSGKSNGNATYSPTDLNAIEGALKWAQQNDSEIWITTMCNAAMYIKERKASKFVKSTSDDKSVTYTLTHSLADEVCEYQYPLSVRVPAPEGWEEIEVTQNDAKLEYEIKEGKIYFQAVPNGGDIVVSKATATPTAEPTTTPTTEPTSSATVEPTPTLKPETTPNVTPTTEPTTSPEPTSTPTPDITRDKNDISPSNPVKVDEIEKTILSIKDEKDTKGSTFTLLKAKGTPKSKKSIKLSWSKVPGAEEYIIYGNKCGKKNKYQKIATVKGTSYTVKKLKKGTYYKYTIVAVKGDEAIATSKTIHVTTDGGKKGNNTKVKLSKTKLSLNAGKSKKIKATLKYNKKVASHRKVAWESDNVSIATVKNGKIKAVGKGSCYVYAYAQNGVSAKIKVTVK